MGNLKDYATSLVAVAPSPADSGLTLEVNAGEADRFPAVPFSCTAHPANEFPTLDNAEQVLVTAITDDEFTIVRAQGDTTAKNIAVGWRISNVLLKADIDSKVDDTTTINGQALSGNITLDADDIDDTSTTNKFTTAAEILKLAGIEAGADITDATNVAAAGAFMKSIDDMDDITDGTTYKKYSQTEKTKLAGIEAAADVTDAANVDAAGATMNADTSLAGYGYFLDQDDMSSNSDTKVPSQQSVKAYVDSLGSTNMVRNETPGGSVNGSNTAFTTASIFATGSLRVYLNGQRLKSGSGNDYVATAQGFTMEYAPLTSDVLLVDYEVTDTTRFIQGSNSIIVQETPTGSVNGSNTAFTVLQAKYVANTLAVFLNGLQQTRGTDYTETTPGSGVFTFTTAPATGDEVRVGYQYSTGASGNADTVDGVGASAYAGVSGALIADQYGWHAINATLTYSSADSPVFVASTSVDLSAFIQKGDRIKLTQTSAKYFIVVAIDSTTITLYGGTDYTLANATISSPCVSKVKSPQGFPMDPTKWTVTFTDTTQRSQGSAANGTWYNLGSSQVVAPIGVWFPYYRAFGIIVPGSSGNTNLQTTLSTANNSESDAEYTATLNAASVSQLGGMMSNIYPKPIVRTTKATYYVNTRYTVATGTTTIYNNNNESTLIIKLVCAYL